MSGFIVFLSLLSTIFRPRILPPEPPVVLVRPHHSRFGRTQSDAEVWAEWRRERVAAWQGFKREWRDYEWLCARFSVKPADYPIVVENEAVRFSGISITRGPLPPRRFI